MDKTVIGIDEAGRGPVLGPMVVSLVRWSNPELPEHLSLNDSKKLTEQQRRDTAEYLIDNVDFRLQLIPAWVISNSSSITQVEAQCISKLLRETDPGFVICDSLGTGNKASLYVQNENPELSIQFESKADERFPAVSAASILAKTTRDQSIEFLKKEWGALGSGYPSDPKTKSWLREWQTEHGRNWPSFVRTNWNTLQKL